MISSISDRPALPFDAISWWYSLKSITLLINLIGLKSLLIESSSRETHFNHYICLYSISDCLFYKEILHLGENT